MYSTFEVLMHLKMLNSYKTIRIISLKVDAITSLPSLYFLQNWQFQVNLTLFGHWLCSRTVLAAITPRWSVFYSCLINSQLEYVISFRNLDLGHIHSFKLFSADLLRLSDHHTSDVKVNRQETLINVWKSALKGRSRSCNVEAHKADDNYYQL